jgi:capsid protein
MIATQIASTADFATAEIVVQPHGMAARFGYDAVLAKNKRQAPTGIIRSEDRELVQADRRKLISAARDIHRNFAVAAWMIRRHLDYVTTFTFQARTGDKALNRVVEERMAWWSRRENFDSLRRHGLDRFIRLAELGAVQTGDVFAVKLANGTVQAIEGDRVAVPYGGLPPDVDPARLVHGVLLDDFGRSDAFCVCRRGQGPAWMQTESLTFERLVPARDIVQHGFFDRFDQVRGVSPLAPALNSLRDTYEACDYALAKMKVAQLFTLAVFRGNPEDIVQRSEDAQDYTKIPLSGPGILDMDIGDRAEFHSVGAESARPPVLVFQRGFHELQRRPTGASAVRAVGLHPSPRRAVTARQSDRMALAPDGRRRRTPRVRARPPEVGVGGHRVALD